MSKIEQGIPERMEQIISYPLERFGEIWEDYREINSESLTQEAAEIVYKLARYRVALKVAQKLYFYDESKGPLLASITGVNYLQELENLRTGFSVPERIGVTMRVKGLVRAIEF